MSKKKSENINISLSQKIYFLRTSNKMSQEQFADAIGKASGKVISRWECGTCKPSNEALHNIEQTFKVDFSDYYNYNQPKKDFKKDKKIILAFICIFIVFLITLLVFLNARIRKMKIVSMDNDIIVNGTIYITKQEIETYIISIIPSEPFNQKCYTIEKSITYNDSIIYRTGIVDGYIFKNSKEKPIYDLDESITNKSFSFVQETSNFKIKNNMEMNLNIRCLINQKYDIKNYNYTLKIVN